jgi:hypothetical protein
VKPRLAHALALVAAAAAPVAAGTLGGTITAQAGGAPIAGAEVRVWTLGSKGWSILTTTTTDGAGAYAFTLTERDYKLDVRGPQGANYGDRWFDAAAPSAGGYVGEEADVILVGAAPVTGIDVALEVMGGADGTVLRPGGAPALDVYARMERNADPRIHHNDFLDGPIGLVSMRGMVPASDYQLIVHDPAGVRDTLLVGGPYAITAGANGSLGTLQLADYPADPYEGNNAPSCAAVTIDAAALHADPPQPWASSGAWIGPRSGGDVDWYCYTAVEGDRLLITATTEFAFGGATRFSPFVDPVVSFWQGARITKLAEDDDGGGGYFDALVDTGPLAAGCHCAAVSTFGDTGYAGAGQTTAGRYQLRVEMGNRPPVLSIRKGASELPLAPAVVFVDEGDTLSLALGYADADGDGVTASLEQRDAADGPVTDGVLTLGATSGTYAWTPGPTAAAAGPYVLTLTAADGEFTRTRTVLLHVNAVNMPPETPAPVSPVDGAAVADGATPLTWANADDPEADPVAYDVELYVGDATGLPSQTAGVPGDPSGTTAWAPASLPENTHAQWRVRARDPGGALSPWSELEPYLVDAANDPPETPVLVKPADGEFVTVRRPGLSVLAVEDPEDDDVAFVFEIARDANFTLSAWTSEPVPQSALAATTMASVEADLDWGAEYHVRVRAQDDRGGVSGWSDPHRFRIKNNLPPGTPTFEPACEPRAYGDAAPTELVVSNVEDPEAEAVTFLLEVFEFDADPQTAPSVYDTTAPMDLAGLTTAIPVDLAGLPNGRYRYRVRADDGTDVSPWIECEFSLALPDNEPGTPAAGCCSTGARPVGAWALAALVLGLLRRRRRR